MSIIQKYILATKYLLTRIESTFGQETIIDDIVIFDDIFPHPLSVFRMTEYNEYIHKYKNVTVATTGSSFNLIQETRKLSEVIDQYHRTSSTKGVKIVTYNPDIKIFAKVAYTIFLNNISNFLEIIEKNRLPFIFTLYPGGGFEIYQHSTKVKLETIFSSKFFTNVIVTQNITHKYLIDNKLCDPRKITYIYGGVLPSSHSNKKTYLSKKKYPQDKKSFDICFVANKYIKNGTDKGFDTFISVAKALHGNWKDIRFHVVGKFDPTDIDVTELSDSVEFHGVLSTDELRHFYLSKDIILSPNVPFILGPGSFDGFPTGACVEAGMAQVALFLFDKLNMNTKFKDKEEIVILPDNIQSIVSLITHYYQNLEELYLLSYNGSVAINREFNVNIQMDKRFAVINSVVSKLSMKSLFISFMIIIKKIMLFLSTVYKAVYKRVV